MNSNIRRIFVCAARGDGKSNLTFEQIKEMIENEQEETRLRAQRLATAIDRGQVENFEDISFEELLADEHRFSGLVDE